MFDAQAGAASEDEWIVARYVGFASATSVQNHCFVKQRTVPLFDRIEALEEPCVLLG